MSINKFDRSKCISPSHPKALATHTLLHSLSQYHITVSTPDSRGLSVQYRAFESKAKMSAGDGKAPILDGVDCIPLCHDIRASMIEIAYEMNTPDNVLIEPVTLGNVSCYWFTYPGMHDWKDGRFIVYYHGGCWMFGDIYSHSGIASTVSKSFNCPLLFVDYRLAPEALWPEQRNDAIAVHKGLLELDSSAASRMITYGESAGGNLSLVHVQGVIANNLPVPALCVSVSPATDFEQTGSSWIEQADTELYMSKAEGLYFYTQCVGGNRYVDKLKTTEMNVLNGSFKGYCPTYIATGGAEILKSDAEIIAAEMLHYV
jgi:acetyl esterase/lipase